VLRFECYFCLRSSRYCCLNMHLANVCKICFFWLRQVRRIRRSLDVESVKTLVYSFVTHESIICNSVLAFAPKKVTDKLQQVQNAAARLITWTLKHERAWSFTAVAWWSALADDSTAGAVQTCRDCSSVSSVPTSKVPRRLLHASLLSSRQPTSASRRKLNIKRFHSSTFDTRAFSVAGSELNARFVVWSDCRVGTF